MMATIRPAILVAATLVLVAAARRARRNKARRDGVLEELRAPIGSPEADRQTLRALREAGADLAKATEVNYYMYFPSREAADLAATEVSTSDFSAVVREGAQGDAWLCLATARMVPSESAILACSARFLGIAQALGGEYDGWEAAVR